MKNRAGLIIGAILVLLVVALVHFLPRPGGVSRVYSVPQFVQSGTGPFWITSRRTVFLIRGILRRAPMQPIADFVLSDNGSANTGSGGIALTSGPPDSVVSFLLRLAALRPLLPHTPDNPLLGEPATYRVAWIGCPPSGCSRSPWQLASGGR